MDLPSEEELRASASKKSLFSSKPASTLGDPSSSLSSSRPSPKTVKSIGSMPGKKAGRRRKTKKVKKTRRHR